MTEEGIDVGIDVVINALSRKVGFEVVNKSVTHDQVRLQGRIPSSKVSAWVHSVVTHLSSVSKKSDWDIDLSKHYFDVDGQTRYAWRIILQGDGIAKHYSGIASAVLSAKVANTEIMETSLHVSSTRNDPRFAQGRGASVFGQAVIGATAKASMGRGG